jgi:hypothetical protein
MAETIHAVDLSSKLTARFVWLVLIFCERKVLLADCWRLVCSERKVLLAGD